MAIAAVVGTSLLANDRRNIRQLARFLGIELPAPSPPVKIGIVSKETTLRRSMWPWISYRHTPSRLSSVIPATQMCDSLAKDGQEEPRFMSSEQGGWDCSMLLQGLDQRQRTSLFLQARGRTFAAASEVRVKFSLNGVDMDDNLIKAAFHFIHVATGDRDAPPSTGRMQQKLTHLEDFYRLEGNYVFTFRREIQDTDRYNLIALERRVDLDVEQLRFPTTRPHTTGARKGDRLSTFLSQRRKESVGNR
ncbi:DUF6030 family protein [Neorhizobium sp. NCHU2750]|uniref:DUF6030 family protein n=1 Tax=Neorhizobium sp. NCHU2750 TaxID=1825976 RepID=UPI0013C45687